MGISLIPILGTVPGDRRHDARLHIDLPDSPVKGVRNVQCTIGPDGQTTRAREGRLVSGHAIAGVPGLPRSCNRRNNAGVKIEPAHPMITLIGDIQTTFLIQGQGRWLIERRRNSRTAIAGPTLLAGAGDGRDKATVSVDFSNAMV